MKHIFLKDLELQPTQYGGRSRVLFCNPDLRVANLVLEPGESVSSHTAPVEVVFIVLAGSGRIAAGDQEMEIGEGEAVICPPGVPRSIAAAAAESLNLLVVRKGLL